MDHHPTALDAELARAVRRTGHMRQLFYIVVLLVALAGQVSGAVEALGIPLIWAIPAVGALELGGVVVLANADVRRRLGEKATASRVLSVAIAAFAVAFNWMAHSNKLLAAFFAGMSALGYLVWLMHTENQRRDRLRATGDLPAVTPAYEIIGHWARHPWLTLRAMNLAKADERLGLYGSLTAAKAERRREVRTAAIAKVLHRKIRASVDPATADIATAVYDLDEIAVRLADGADYDGLTALIAADLAPTRLAPVDVVVVESTVVEREQELVPVPSIPRPRRRPSLSIVPTSGGPAIEWDVDKAVRMILDKRPAVDVASACGVSTKTVQRTNLILREVSEGLPDESIVRPSSFGLGMVRLVRASYDAAMKERVQ